MTFKELDDSFDGETFFLYVLLAATALLVILGLNYAFTNKVTLISKSPYSFIGRLENLEKTSKNIHAMLLATFWINLYIATN